MARRDGADEIDMAGPSSTPVSLARLLLVDDDAALLRAFERTFRKVYEIRTALSALEALRLLGDWMPDVLVTDFSMPGISGVDLLFQVKRLHPSIARIMLTAFADLPEVVALEQAGLASAVLRKPWDRDDLVRAIAEATAPGT
jgi:DNA-binding NtrC family response regulator